MNQVQLKALVDLIPVEATEIIVKGRDTEEAFFTMVKEWKPSDELKGRITQAPPAMNYKKDGQTKGRNGNRWRIK